MKYLLLVTLMGFFGAAQAEDSTLSKTAKDAGGAIKEGAQDTSKNTKQVYRDVKDKACKMVNGKMECLPQEVKHKTQNAADEVSDKANDLKKK